MPKLRWKICCEGQVIDAKDSLYIFVIRGEIGVVDGPSQVAHPGIGRKHVGGKRENLASPLRR